MRPTCRCRSCGLGSAGTDLLVELVQAEATAAADAGRAPPLFGGKITGGGSGGECIPTHFSGRGLTHMKHFDLVSPLAGTVCVVGSSDSAAEDAIERVRHAYRQARGYLPQVFDGSSMGAHEFGVVTVQLRTN